MISRANYLFIFVIFFGVISLSKPQTQKLSKIKTKGKWFVDEDERIILFRGINAVQKNFPWIPNADSNVNMTNTTLLSLYKSWGYNAVRLGFMWSGLYPGVPLWVLNEIPKSKHPFPWPLKKVDPGSFSGYITAECGFSFQCLYHNISNTETYFHEYWATVAQILNNRTSVLAYELMNEPWAGDIYSDPFIILPGIADKFNLMNFYDKVYPVIREYDKETLVMYEPVTWGTMAHEGVLGTGFDHPPGNDSKGTVLSWHYYCWLLEFQATNNINPLVNDTLPNFSRYFCNEWQLNTYFDVVESDMKKLGDGASFLTEFGWCAFPETNGTYNLEACEAMLNGCDQHFQSWTFWDSGTLVDSNYDPLVNLFTRVYPVATNGIPLKMMYNTTTRDFFYSFQLNVTSFRESILTTDIFVPQYLYPNSFNVNTSENLDWKFDPLTSKVLLFLKTDLIKQFKNMKEYVYSSQASVTLSAN